ncbi:MAG: hypothetical protein AAF607_06230 [Pseudomonadota bacterium]
MTWFPPTYADWLVTQPPLEFSDPVIDAETGAPITPPAALNADPLRLEEDAQGNVLIDGAPYKPGLVHDVRAIYISIRGGQAWAPQPVRAQWFRDGTFTARTYAEALGAPQSHLDAMQATEPTLADAKAAAEAEIDGKWATYQASLLTVAPAQMPIYERKEAVALELHAVLAGGGQPDPVAHRILVQEASLSGMTIEALVTEVLINATLWRDLAETAEPMRMAAKRAVRVAANETAVRAIVDQLQFPMAPQ